MGQANPAVLTFDTRPAVTFNGDAIQHCESCANSTTPFQYPAGKPDTHFQKVIQFSPGGEARVNNTSNAVCNRRLRSD